MKKGFIILVLIAGISSSMHAQDRKLKSHPVVVNFENSFAKANVLDNPKRKMHPDENTLYFWYSNNKISFTRGGFTGKLLHGEYTEYYADGNLKTKGRYYTGIRKGKWMKWFTDGRLAEVCCFKNGLKQGSCRIYSKNGGLQSEQAYKRGVAHGKKISFSTDGKPIKKEVFKRGILIDSTDYTLPKEKKKTGHKEKTLENPKKGKDAVKKASEKKKVKINTSDKEGIREGWWKKSEKRQNKNTQLGH